MKTERLMKGVGRKEAKKIVRETEEKAKANGWNPNSGVYDPTATIQKDGMLTNEEYYRYNASRSILKHTADLDEGVIREFGGVSHIMKELNFAYGCVCSNDMNVHDRFKLVLNSLALRMLTDAETAVMPDTRKFAATVKAVHEREIGVEAENEEEAKRIVKDLVKGGEHIEEIREIEP